MIAQTSNEHLDELNARAQAIRQQKGELGKDGLRIPGRPYQLHAGDEVQVRHTINHPDHGPLRNGTSTTIAAVDPRSGELTLQLAGGDELVLDKEQIEQADLRLAYVQHPFPAQGHTTDTAHVTVGSQVTREGTYVAISRARADTHIYAATADMTADKDPIDQLAERVSHSEPEVASIKTPLAHENTIITIQEIEATARQIARPVLDEINRAEPGWEQVNRDDPRTLPTAHGLENEPRERSEQPGLEDTLVRPPRAATDTLRNDREHANERPEPADRAWPSREQEAEGLAIEEDEPERDNSLGWEL